MSTSQGGATQIADGNKSEPGQKLVAEDAFSQMMQLMFGFCRNSNCNAETVKQLDSEADFETMNTIFTQSCPSLTL